MKKLTNLMFLLTLAASANVVANESTVAPTDQNATICRTLLTPHLAIAEILPNVSDDNALRLLKANYSELSTWLSQKADATAEGTSAAAKGNYGPDKNQTPSQLLFNENIVEVNRTAVGFLALKWILANDYDSFTRNQPPPVKLSRESFSELRKYVMSVLKTPEDIDAMIVMILTNDLGKVKRFHEITEKAAGRAIVDHDNLLFVGFSEWAEISPNFQRLPEKQKNWILDGLKMGSDLNVGQFAQAENLPANLAGVKALTGKPEAFEFKFVELLLDVAGANGHMDSSGAKVMIEPVFKSFMLARTALSEVISGGSLRSAYDQILIQTNNRLVAKGFQSLSVKDPNERAVLRLLTLRRTQSREDALELLEVFNSIHPNARGILVSELNVDGVEDGWGILPYYAPALFNNAISSLNKVAPPSMPVKGVTPPGALQWQSSGAFYAGSSPSREAIRTTLLALARVFQESRIQLRGRTGNGVFVVNVEQLAKHTITDQYRENPSSLLNAQYVLFKNGGDDNQYGVRMVEPKTIDINAFQKGQLKDIPGHKIAVIGIGGGSDGVQAAQLATLLKASGKEIKFVGSVRTSKTGSQNAKGVTNESRTIENHGGEVVDGVFRVLPTSKGSGRFLENLPAELFPTYLIVDEQNGTLEARIRASIKDAGNVDTIIAVDTGGDALFSETVENGARATPDQDLRVLNTLANIKEHTILTAEIAVGVDSPDNAQDVLLRGGATYISIDDSMKAQVLAQYKAWGMDGTDPNRFGKTPLAWQLALSGQFGLQTLNLPTRIVLDQKNPWNPFSLVQQATSGIFVMTLPGHLHAIGPK